MARAKKVEPKLRTINRKIFFYRVNAGIDPATGEPLTVHFGPSLKHLETLPFTAEGRYLEAEDGKQLCCYPESMQFPYRLKLANIRRGQHPPIENAGTFSPLVLSRGQGLAEITHLVLFADGICGAEFNYYGPRVSQFAFYCALKIRGICPGFRLNPITRPDLEARLAALHDIKFLDLKVRASFAAALTEADEDLGAAFAANIKVVSARPEDEFELKFIRKKGKKLTPRTVSTSLLEGIRRLAKRSDLKEQVSIFKVTGQGGPDNRLVDVLREQFTMEAAIKPALDESGAVDSESMYAAIEEAYGHVQKKLATASEIE